MYGHNIESIKQMTSSQLNIYMSAITELEAEQRLADLYIQRVAAHAEGKDFSKFESTLSVKKKKVMKKIPKEWMED